MRQTLEERLLTATNSLVSKSAPRCTLSRIISVNRKAVLPMPRSDTHIKNNIDQFEKEHGQIEVDQTIVWRKRK